jgi:hypothetical protein
MMSSTRKIISAASVALNNTCTAARQRHNRCWGLRLSQTVAQLMLSDGSCSYSCAVVNPVPLWLQI